MTDPLVSIIVPVYNAEKYVERCIDALMQQTLHEIEIILVDDGSTDESARLCNRACVQDGRVRVVSRQNGGVSSARNTGLALASGEYVMFCDADDAPHASMAQRLYERAEVDKVDCVLCEFLKETSQVIDEVELPKGHILQGKDAIMHTLIMPMLVWGYAPNGKPKQSVYGSVWRCLYRRKTIERKHLRFDAGISLGEDMLFSAHYWASCERIALLHEALYTYYENMQSATHSNARLWEQYLDVWEKAHSFLEELRSSDDNVAWHNYQLTRYATAAIISIACSRDCSVSEKLRGINRISQNRLLVNARKRLPKDLNRKNRLLTSLMRPSFAPVLMAYYQMVQGKD